MEIKIEKKAENNLLKRMEIEGIIAFQGATPSNKDITAELAKQLGTSEDLIEIKNIITRFGRMIADFKAHIYKDKETLLKTEPKKKIKEEKKEAE